METVSVSNITITEKIYSELLKATKVRKVNKVDYQIYVDGELVYEEAGTPKIKSGSGLKKFIDWLDGIEAKNHSCLHSSEEAQEMMKKTLARTLDSLGVIQEQ